MTEHGAAKSAQANLMLAAALDYAKQGKPVFPCRGKTPMTKRGFLDASTGEKQIQSWWTKWPNANIGIPTGTVSGLFAVDVDGVPGEDSLRALEGTYGTLPRTRTIITSPGHLQFWFAQPANVITKSTAGVLGKGLDIRGDGGYVVAPPSIHPETGKPYLVSRNGDPLPAPSWLLELTQKGSAKPSGARETSDSIPEGQRNTTLTSWAGKWRRQGLGESEILEHLRLFNSHRRKPPLPEFELVTIAASIGKKPADSGPETAAAGVQEEWPEPEPLGEDLPAVPAFSLDMLPETFRPMVMDTAERMQVPLDLPGATAIVALAASVNRRARILPKVEDDTWSVIPNLWGVIVAPPGFMKSPVMQVVMKPLADTEEMWRESYDSDMEQFEKEQQLKKLAHQAWQQQYKAALKKKEEDLPPEPDITLRPPVKRRLILMDATPEKLHEILEENPAGVLVLRDELIGLIAEMDREGRESQRALFQQAWNGYGGHTIDRIERGSHHVPNVCLSLFGLIQPARLRWYLAETMKGGPSDDGLFQRLQVMVWPDVQTDWELVDRPPNNTARACAAKVLSRLSNLPTESVRLRFAPDARKTFYEWWGHLENKVRGSAGMHAALISHLSKYRSLMPSLAGLFELADLVAQDVEIGEEAEIRICHAEQAIKTCAYLEAHAHRVYSCVSSVELHAARELAKHITRGALPDSFSIREVYRHNWAGLDSPERVVAALAALEDAGWVRRAKTTQSAAGGRPSDLWMVNPQVRRRGG